MNRLEKLKELLQASSRDNFLRHAVALEFIKEGNDTDARNLFEEILTDDPSYIASYYHLAKLLERNGETDLAIEWYQKGMKAAKDARDNRAYSELQSAYEDLIY